MEQPLTGHRAAPRTTTYPIVDAWSLTGTERSGFLGLGGRRLAASEMAPLLAHDSHQVLVYRVDGQLVEDRGELNARDLADATYVSVVDMRRNAPVEVRFQIPSKDAKAFTVVVTFGCTVTDPVLVVRHGLIDPQQLLTNHVRSYHNAMRMALDYSVDEFTEARRAVDDELTAFHAVRPPVVDGLAIQLSSIEIDTPEEVKEVWDKMLQAGHERRLRASELTFKEKHEYERLRVEEKLRSQEEAYLRDSTARKDSASRHAERLTALHQEELADLHGQAGRQRRAVELDARIEELTRIREFSGALSDQVMYQAFLDGKLDPNEMATLLRQDRERRELQEREDAERNREHARELEQMDREERRELERARRDDRHDDERYLREIEQRRAQLDVDERDHRWKVEEDLRREAREAEQVTIEAKLRFLTEARADEELRRQHGLEAAKQRDAVSLERLRFHGELEGKRLDVDQARAHQQADRDHETRVKELDQKWKTDNEQRLFEQATREREFQAKLRLLEELSKHGHLNLVDLNVGAAINKILSDTSDVTGPARTTAVTSGEPMASLGASGESPDPATEQAPLTADAAYAGTDTKAPEVVVLPGQAEEAGRA